MRRPEEDCNIATRISVVIYAIRKMIESGLSANAPCPARPLSSAKINELQRHGLHAILSPYVFISPSSFTVTALWFCRTNHAWYWTPTKPKTYEIDDLKLVNWSLIARNMDIVAVGGRWNGEWPAFRNIELIRWIADTDQTYL